MDKMDSKNASRVWFTDVWLLLPKHWVDITETLPNHAPPTLAIETGFGVLQFSIARYVSGDVPVIDIKTLERMLYNFEDKNDLNRSMPLTRWKNDSVFGLYCDYSTEGEFIRAWYCSDGQNSAFVSYVSQEPTSNDIIRAELAEAESIVNSIRFDEWV